MIDCGTVEEDGTVTWETLVRPVGIVPGDGGPVIHSGAPLVANEPVAGLATKTSRRTE